MTPILALCEAPSEPEERDAPLVQRLVTPFARWPFRLFVLVALVPLLTMRWKMGDIGVVMLSGALQTLVAMPLAGLAEGVRRRGQAAAQVSDTGRLAEINGTAVLFAVMTAILLELGWWTAAPTLATMLTLGPGMHSSAVAEFLRNEAMQVATLPLLLTALAMAEAQLTEVRRGTLRGAIVLIEGMTLLAVPGAELPPQAWPVLCTASHLWMIALLVVILQQSGRTPLRWRFARAEATALFRSRNSAVVPEPGLLPAMYCAVAIAAAADRPSAVVVPAATVALVGAVAAVGWHLAAHLEPLEVIADLHADAYRARWRFKRSLDAAMLVALGIAVPLAFFGKAAVQSWLGVRNQSSTAVAALAVLALVSAPVALSSQWLRRANRTQDIAGIRGIEVLVAMPLVTLCWSYAGWPLAAWALVASRVATTGWVLPRAVARHLGITVSSLVLDQAWRLALVALPSTVTAACFVLFKPARNGREWTIQILIVTILFVIPAFAAWSLMDTRKDDA